MTKRVTLAYPYTTPGGRPYRPDTTVTIDDGEADRLLRGGLARLADDQDGPEVEEPPTTDDDVSSTEEG